MVEHNQSQYYGNQYKFNGKELDSTTGMYYYGARYYEPRFSIFVSVDPLAEQTMTPYQYVNNNPINFIDPDGRNGIRIVNSSERTITVKANYYVQTASRPSDYAINGQLAGYSVNTIENLNKGINEAFNSANMVISEGEYKGYTVKFDLQFFDGGTVANAEKLAKADMYEYNGQSYNIGNSYSRWDESHDDFRETFSFGKADSGTQIAGQVESNQFLTMNIKSEGNIRVNKKIWHEIFHTFGRKDNPVDKKGIMNYPPGFFSQDDIDFFGKSGKHKNDLSPYTRENRILPIIK